MRSDTIYSHGKCGPCSRYPAAAVADGHSAGLSRHWHSTAPPEPDSHRQLVLPTLRTRGPRANGGVQPGQAGEGDLLGMADKHDGTD